MHTKESVRELVRARLAALPMDRRMLLSEEVEERVWEVPEVRSASTLLLYASMASEISTDSIADEASRRGIRIVYPRCLPGSAMSLHSVSRADELRPGGIFGIREPAADCPLIEVEEIDVAFLPGLAWDRRGGRLGRGAGYYDRLLSAPGWEAARCGLFYSVQEVPRIPVDPWDVPLDLAITELEVVRF